jgi:hypothetical protein
MMTRMVHRIVRKIRGMIQQSKFWAYRILRIVHRSLGNHERTSRFCRGMFWAACYILLFFLWKGMISWVQSQQMKHQDENELLLHALQPFWKHHPQNANITAIFLQRLNSTQVYYSPFHALFLGGSLVSLIFITCGSIPFAYEGWPRLLVFTGELAFYMETSLGHWENRLMEELEREWLLDHLQSGDLVNLVEMYFGTKKTHKG